MLSQVQPKAATGVDDEMFLLDGFDEEEALYGVEGVDGESAGGNGGNPLEERGNPMAFPQSDDEEISTDGESVSILRTCSIGNPMHFDEISSIFTINQQTLISYYLAR